jgi:hypothetical protein
LGVSRDTIHRWIRAGDLDRDLETTPVRYGPRPTVPTKLVRLVELIVISWNPLIRRLQQIEALKKTA